MAGTDIYSQDLIWNKTGIVQDQPTGEGSTVTGDWTQVGPTWTSYSEPYFMQQPIGSSSVWEIAEQMNKLLAGMLAKDLFKNDPLLEYLKSGKSQSEPGSCLKPSVEVKAHHNGFSKSKGIQKRFIEKGLV